MKKRIIAILLAVVFVLCLVPATASAAPVTGDGYSFDTETGELTVTTDAGTTAWRKNTAIAKSDVKSLTIGDEVETIGNGAFYNCTALKSVTIPDNVKTIGTDAFLGCEGITSLTMGNGVKTIGNSAFWYCISLTSLTIGDGVETIELQAFLQCTALTSLTIGDSVKTIGNEAFENCTSLRKITSEAMTAPTIGSKAFDGIPADVILYIPGGATGYDAPRWPQNAVKLWTISGIVKDETGKPVADAAVDINGTIATTDENGKYSMPMFAQNGAYAIYAEKSGYMLGYTEVTVADADITDADITMTALSAPAISGPTTMTLTEGYAATSSKKFTITGAPTPYVTATGNDSITWNDDTQCLDIAAGLPIGTYEVTLTANNVFLPDALDGSKIKALNVPAPEIEPATHVFTLTVKAPDPVIVEYTLTFETNGGSGIDSVIMEENSVIDLSSYKTTRSGYSFSGWYSDEALKNKVTSVTLTADTTVYAGWDKAETPDIPETGDFFSGILLPMTTLAMLLGVAIAILKVRMLSLKSRMR